MIYEVYWRIDSIWYYILLLVFICMTLGIYFYLRHKSKQFIFRFLMGISIANTLLHFLKLVFPPYVNEFKMYDNLRALRVIGFENICAVNTILGPLLLSCKEKHIKDYYMLIGFCGGLFAICLPMSPYTTRSLFSFDMFRYFICHYSLFVIPLMSYLLKIHTFNFKRAWALPICFFGCMSLIYINENVTFDLGWISEKRNFSMVYGPIKEIGKVGDFLISVVPNFLKNYVDNQGNLVAVAPLIWLVFPFVCFILPLAYLVEILLDFSHFKESIKKIYASIQQKIKKRN